MRIIEKCWVEVNAGHQAVVSLEARLQSDWKRAIQVAQKRNDLTAKAKRDRTRKIAGITFIALLFICILVWVGIFYIPESRAQLLVYFCVLAFPGIISGIVYTFHLGSAGSRASAADHPSLDLVEPWWKSLRPKRYVIQTSGGRAEVDFLKSLSFLDNNYIAVWGLGPSGIWVFEVKYWNGIISKHDGVWYADYKSGGRKTHDKSPDEQWVAQKDEISKTIRMRLRSKPWLEELIKGGVVFAHQNAAFGQITGHKAAYGKPGSWHKRIRETKPVRNFSIEDQLQLLDALILYANRHEKEKLEIVSAREEAHQLHDNAVAALRKYVSERVK